MPFQIAAGADMSRAYPHLCPVSYKREGLPELTFYHLNSGRRIFLDPRDPYIWAHVLETGCWEEHLDQIFQEALSGGGVYVDVGANIGLHVLNAFSFTDQIYAFEPDPVTFKVLQLNSVANGGYDFSLHQKALSDQQGEMKFYRDPVSSGLSRLLQPDVEKEAFLAENISPVEISTLDRELADVKEVALLKIDVEGFEEQVLRGAMNIVDRSRKITIALEFRPEPGLVSVIEQLAEKYEISMRLLKWPDTTREINDISRLDTLEPGTTEELIIQRL